MPTVTPRFRRSAALAAALICGLAAGDAAAHPHVFVASSSTVDFDADGRVTAIEHAWTFDEYFAAYATQGLDKNGDGIYSADELKDLAEVNVTSLAEFDYFSFAQAAGKTVTFGQPRDYRLEYKNEQLTLFFTLPLKQPAEAGTFKLEIYDPTYFVAFSFAKDPARLAHAPAPCRLATNAGSTPANASAVNNGKPLGEDFFNSLTATSTFGAQFANVVAIACDPKVDPATLLTAADAGADQAEVDITPADVAAAAAADAAAKSGADPTETAAVVPKSNDRVGGSSRDGSASGPAAVLPAPDAPTASSSDGAFFGVLRPDGVAPGRSGILGFIADRQAAFYTELAGAIRKLKDSGEASLLLVLLAFGYGVLHAAGPGHGKAVISSYIVATGETLKRGVLVSLIASLAQAVTAVGVVGAVALVFGAGAQAIGATAYWLEAASYAAIALVGLRLAWGGMKRFLAMRRGGAHEGHGEPGHVCDDGCGHLHMPDPEMLRGPFDWRKAIGAVLAVGLRPCSGAILVLAFAMAQGIAWAGVAAAFAMAAGTAMTVAGFAALAVGAKRAALGIASVGGMRSELAARGVETLAGVAILTFGLLLLGGFAVSHVV